MNFNRIKKYLLLFQNIKFNIGLFAALAIASVLGTLIPQIPENPDKVQAFIQASPKTSAIFERLQFFNIYYSWWFMAMLGLMAFDVIVCKLIFGKFPGMRTFKKHERKETIFSSLKLRQEWNGTGSLKDAEQKISAALAAKKFAVETIARPDGSVLFLASRWRLQRFGSWISHISIVLILLSNLTGALYGFREVLNIPEGTTARMQNRAWSVTCDDFKVDWYPNSTTPKTFASQLRLFSRGRLAAQKEIMVNEPLEYRKTRFYQASYGPYLKEARIGVFLRKSPKQSPTVMARLNEDVPVPGTPYSLRILQFMPDFHMDEGMSAGTKSAQPNNPALQILVSKNGKPVKAPWIFEHYPGMHMPPIEKEDDFILILAEYVPSYYTGLQITYDPGADLFWIACAILVFGLMILFYLHHKKIWILLQAKEQGSTRIHLGAFSSRGKSFENDFLNFARELQGKIF